MTFLEQSYEFLIKVRYEKPILDELRWFSNAKLEELKNELDDDIKKKTFWINMYNAIFQHLAKIKKLKTPQIFKTKAFRIGNYTISLDDIEHGILRKNRHKYSFGYFSNPLTPTYIKDLSIDKIDFRIHFALNCGAKSCPPIAFYYANALDTQLDTASISFLSQETVLDHEHEIVYLTKLCYWFIGDFKGKKGLLKMLQDYLDFNHSEYTIKYLPYSWKSQLDNFV